MVEPVISNEINSALTRTISRKEVKAAAFQIGPLKAPGGKKGVVAVKLDLNKAYDRIRWDFLIKVCNTIPSRGLRQGNPLSPYFFLIVSNVFSTLINKAVLKKSLVGICLRKKCPIISHLLFADDSLVFLEAKAEVCSNFKDLVMSFSEASGLSINFQKFSLFFSANTKEDLRNEIKDIFGIEVMKEGSKYLGLPMFWGRSKKEAMAYIKDKILGKIHGWKSRTLPQASKEVLINGDGGGKIHWGSCEKLTEAKRNGGMGFRDLEAFNCALLAKQFWRMMQTPMLTGYKCLKSDNWIPSWSREKPISYPPPNCQWTKVYDFINPTTNVWDVEKLQSSVSAEEVSAIIKIPVSITKSSDQVIWSQTRNGKYTVKSGYAQAFKPKSRGKSQRPFSSRSLPNKFWTKLWATPTIPKVRNFIWRVIRNWVACKDNLCKRKCAHSPLCPICELEQESVEHVLFRCAWTEVCWAIWKARNDCIFNGVMPQPERTIDQAKRANFDYLQASFEDVKERATNPNRIVKWSPPPPSFIKFNCDGAFSSSRSLAIFGCLARDCGGRMQFFRSGRIVASSALVTEAWALRIACGMAVDMGISKAIFESN
ncbi:uncharacterized protein LOC131332256 [Rhododendron vialii]|uniref:uncharacterized protein LOC131332256 n=1 Tax=Rhododendron vialii TaxID=182163 RepID=UPI00265EC9DF|nr:uncharacterized protein LOC131332256 [Rhododendron vialii]